MAILINLLDDDTRPKAPPIPEATAAHRAHGHRLALFHVMHLRQLTQAEVFMERVAAGQAELAAAGEAIVSLQMANNYRVFGNLCGQECQHLTFHHTGEDQMVFPKLMTGSEGLRRVVERLAQEHEVIHAILVQLTERASKLFEEPTQPHFEAARETLTLLGTVVRSHFRYEETELQEALGYHRIPL